MGQNEIIDSDTYRKIKKKTARNLQISFCIMVMSCSENRAKQSIFQLLRQNGARSRVSVVSALRRLWTF